jgi:hypothetical protein
VSFFAVAHIGCPLTAGATASGGSPEAASTLTRVLIARPPVAKPRRWPDTLRLAAEEVAGTSAEASNTEPTGGRRPAAAAACKLHTIRPESAPFL